MTKRRIYALTLTAAIWFAVPIQARIYAIDTWAQLSSEQRLIPGAPIWIYVGPEVSDDPLHRELGEKIRELLRKKGFVLAAQDEAEFHLLFDFGSTERESNPSLLPFRAELDLGHSRSEYTHYFIAAVVDARAFRETGETSVVWKGQSVLSDHVSKNPGGKSEEQALAILDLLWTATFEVFGTSQDWSQKNYKAPKSGKKSPQ